MKFLSIKKTIPILISAVFFGMALSPTNVLAAKTKSDKNLVIKHSDFKNGVFNVKDCTLNSITINGTGKKATISLMNVQVKGALNLEKGNYVLKTKNSSLKTISILQDSKIILDENSNLNKKDLKINVNSGVKASVSLPEYINDANITLGKKSLLNIKIGNYDKADLIVKKSATDSVIIISGIDEDAKLKSLTIDSAVKGSIKVDVGLLNVTKKADGSSLSLDYNADKIDNKSNVEILKKGSRKDDSNTKSDNKNQTGKQESGNAQVLIESDFKVEKKKKEAAEKFDKEAENIKAAMPIQNARDLLKKLDALVNAVGLTDLSHLAKAENVNKYNILKSELNTYDLFNQPPADIVVLDDKGTVTLKQSPEMELKAILHKNNNVVNLPEYSNLAPTRTIEKGTTTFSMLKEMRAAGVGEYTVQMKISGNLTYINVGNSLDNKTLKSNGKSVEEMNNPWLSSTGSFIKIFDAPGRESAKEFLRKAMSPEGISGGAVSVKNGVLSWDPVDDAQFYDIYADFTFASNEGYLGNKYRVDEKIGVNNETNIQDLKFQNNISSLIVENNQNNPKRVLLGSVTTPEITLKELCLLTSTGFFADMNNPNWYRDWAESSDPSTPIPWLIKVKIIPRNISGLKINSILSLSSNNESVQVNGIVHPAIFWRFEYNGGFKDFAQIILGKSFD